MMQKVQLAESASQLLKGGGLSTWSSIIHTSANISICAILILDRRSSLLTFAPTSASFGFVLGRSLGFLCSRTLCVIISGCCE